MNVFQDFYTWMTQALLGYLFGNATALAQTLQPVIVTLATLYVMIWGYLQLTAQIDEPILEGIKRISTMAVILALSMDLWLYGPLIVDTFFNAPDQLGAAILAANNAAPGPSGAPAILGAIAQLWAQGFAIGDLLWSQAGFTNGIGFYIAALAVYAFVGLLAAIVVFYMSLAKVALALLLTLGPLFIALLFFDATKRFFEAWIAQLANYGFMAILTVLVAKLVLKFVGDYAAAAAALGTTITNAHALRLVFACLLGLLVLRQVMPMAAGLASGVALSSGNLISRALRWGTAGTGVTAYQFGRGLMDTQTSRFDPLTRMSGYQTARLGRALWRSLKPGNAIQKTTS
jgi:type IV secretion system protein VirB6